jgi:hypothetical protein
MPDILGTITVPEITPSGTLPILAEYPFVQMLDPAVVTHQFGSANAKIEQRFYLGTGARRFVVRRTMSRTEREALRDFWEAMGGPSGAFTFQVPNPDGSTTATTCRFENAPLTFDHLSNAVASVGVVLVEIPSTAPSYSLNSTQTRFPAVGLPAALLSQVQELIPLVKIQARAAGYPAIYVSDRRCTVGGQLYQARLLHWSSISQSVGNDADDANFVFGNADRVMRELVNTVDLWRATIEFALFHVAQGVKLDLWRGEIVDWDLDSGPEFPVRATDGIYELTLPYPTRRVDRGCWKVFNGPACPYSSAGSGGNPASCDKGFDTLNGCASHGMQRYFGGIVASPQGVRIRDNANGRRTITATSIIGDSAYSQTVPEIYTNVPIPVAAKIIAGRDEGEFYDALGIVGEGPLGAFDPDPLKQLLDNQPPHGPAPLGLRTALGTDPAGASDQFVLTETGASPPSIFAAGTAFAEIRRTDQKGIQPTALTQHQMQVSVSQGLSGWVWSAPGVRSQQLLTNPVWIAINCLLRARGLRFSTVAECEQYFDVSAAIAAAALCDASVAKVVGTGSETQFRFNGILQEEKPLRDWIQEILMTALGYYTFAFGRLKVGIRNNSSVVEAFTNGNILFNSLELKPIRPTFNHLTANFADEEFEFLRNTVTLYDIDQAQLIGGATAPVFLKSEMNLVGCPSKSQAARVVTTRLREELGGYNLTQQRKARGISFRTTVLALNVEPGMVCSMTHPDMPDGGGEFRVSGWRLNGDNSIDVSGRTTTDEMYDLTVGPKPADVAATPVPAEIGFSKLPVPPWGGNVETPLAGNPLYSVGERFFGLRLVYEGLADVGTLAKLEVSGAAPVTSFYTEASPVATSYSTGTAGGTIPANSYVTIVFYGINAAGKMTAPSSPVTVRVGAGNTNQITVSGITWPAGVTGYWVFASTNYGALCRQIAASGAPTSFTLTSLAAVRNYTLPSSAVSTVRMLVYRLKHSGVDGLQIGAVGTSSITIAGAAWTANEWVGRIVSIISDASDGSAQIRDYTVSSNTADTFTVAGTPQADGVEPGDVLILRTKATSFSSTSIGDAKWQNASYPSGMTPNEERGLLVRIIGGTGKGQVRRIVANSATVHTVDQPWDVTPNASSVYIVQEPGYSYVAESAPIDNDAPDNLMALTLPVDNLLGQTLLVEVQTIDKFGVASASENNQWREVYLPGDPGTVATAEVGISYA